ncbi:MAG: divalent metal cation transporter [Alphaproteobacteria bacterium]|nr:divalent metal cation transporter [Alphaproteobacteria bacterium]
MSETRLAAPEVATDAPTGAASERRPRWRNVLAFLGPGLITGAADDDPSGIATYSQIGAQFGYGLNWTMLFSYPLMAAIQEISARIGRVTGKGIAGNMREHYPAWLLHAIVLLLLVANIINIGADLGAMGDGLALVIGGSVHLYVVLFALLCAGLEIFVRYQRYVAFLKWATLSLFAYVATVLFAGVPWRQVAYSTLVPSIAWDRDSLVAIVAILGTTISPYLFFWQASEEAEDERVDAAAEPLIVAPEQAPIQLRRIRLDTYFGMGLSNLISLFIMITAAATLHAHGVVSVKGSAEAAEALRPFAGDAAFFVFAAGIIGTGMLAIPVLAGSAAYAVAEALRWPSGLGRRALEARAFYASLGAATLIGTAINFVSIDPIQALFWTAVINGVVAVPLMIIMMLMTARPQIMGPFTLPRPLWVMGWLSTAAMAFTVAMMFATWPS